MDGEDSRLAGLWAGLSRLSASFLPAPDRSALVPYRRADKPFPNPHKVRWGEDDRDWKGGGSGGGPRRRRQARPIK